MIAIVDCNSFYCACEKAFRPELSRKPVVVLSNNDGCIISLTDEAKALGIKMTGPYYMAKPIIEEKEVATFSSNYNLYGDMSRRVMETLRELAGKDNVEVYSVDEAFVDLSRIPAAQLYAFCVQMKETVEQWTGIAVSVGAAPTKVLAKAANRMAKKHKAATKGVLVADNDKKIQELLEQTTVKSIWGVGRKYAFKLEQWGIHTAWELRNMSEEWARKILGGVNGARLIRELRGLPSIEMKEELETKKMITTTRMFGKPVLELEFLKEAVATYVSRAAEKLRRQKCAAKCINVFVVTNNYESLYQYNPTPIHRWAVLPVATALTHELIQHAVPLVEKMYKRGSRYLKAGVILSGLVPDNSIQSNLFESPLDASNHDLMETIDNVNFSMRDDMVKFASSGLKRNWKMRQELRSARYTSRWEELREVRQVSEVYEPVGGVAGSAVKSTPKVLKQLAYPFFNGRVHFRFLLRNYALHCSLPYQLVQAPVNKVKGNGSFPVPGYFYLLGFP
jgi:DNA polymerase V